MLIEELLPGVSLETGNVEFKGILREGQGAEINWLKTIAAFANTNGGDLYVGIEDKSHKIVALDHQTVDKTILMVHRQIRARFTPIPEYEIDALSVESATPVRYIIRIHVNPGKSLPVMIHENGLIGIYVRNYGETCSATPEQVRDMVLLSDNASFDDAAIASEWNPGQFESLRKRLSECGEQMTDKALMSIGFMTSERKLTRGALLFADDCADSRTRISATLWPGLDKGGNIVLANESFEGNLLNGIKFAVDFIRNHSAYGFKKEANGRSDYFAYPARSIVEGVVNAIGHRNYLIVGGQVEINLFQDRLEITSPGALLGVRELRKEKNIASIIPRRRNEVICAVLEMCKYMEEKGSGFDKIETDYSPYGEIYRPFVSADGSSFTLTLPNLTFANGVIDTDTQQPEVYVESLLPGKNDLSILRFCYGKNRSVSEITAQIGVKPSTYFRKQVLGRLVEAGLLSETTTGRTNQYRSNPDYVKLK